MPCLFVCLFALCLHFGPSSTPTSSSSIVVLMVAPLLPFPPPPPYLPCQCHYEWGLREIQRCSELMKKRKTRKNGVQICDRELPDLVHSFGASWACLDHIFSVWITSICDLFLLDHDFCGQSSLTIGRKSSLFIASF